MLMRANLGSVGGVTSVHVRPPSLVTYTIPSSDPVQMTDVSSGDGAIVKIVAYISGPFMSCVIGPPDCPRVFGSARVRSGEMRCHV